jgi:hypothetical protein
MRTRRPLALLVANLLFVTLASGVAAAQTGDGGSLVSLLEGLIELLNRIIGILEGLSSMG